MTVSATTDPKAATTAAPTTDHGCCGGSAPIDPQNKAAKPTDLGHTKASKAADSSCCGGAGKK
jgi:hypothetical protein